MEKTVWLFLLIGAFCVDHTISVLPGFKLRLSKTGLNYANTVAHTALGNELKSLKIPNQQGSDGHLQWELKNIQNRGCVIPSSSMAFNPSLNGLTWSMSNLGIDLHSDWSAKYKKGIIHISTSGSVDISVHHVSVAITIRLAAQSGGRPSVSMAKCDASIGNVDVHFHGGSAWILNLFRKTIDKKVKDLMHGQICKVIAKEINVDANEKLKQLKTNVEVDHRFLVDYSLVAAPAVHTANLEAQFKGEAFWKTDKKEAPFSPKPIQPLADETKMLYLWATDYIANTFFSAGYKHGFLKYNVTENDFPAANRSYLNTTCPLMCIGKLIPQIGKKYPNSKVEARIVALATPNVTITPQSVTVYLDVSTDLFAHTPKNKVEYMITLTLNVSLSVKASVVKEHLAGQITGHSIKVGVVKSAIGKVDPRALNLILSATLDFAVIPKLNSILKKGIDIPVTGVVSFQNTKLKLLNGSLLIATDLRYNKESSDLTAISERDLIKT